MPIFYWIQREILWYLMSELKFSINSKLLVLLLFYFCFVFQFYRNKPQYLTVGPTKIFSVKVGRKLKRLRRTEVDHSKQTVGKVFRERRFHPDFAKAILSFDTELRLLTLVSRKIPTARKTTTTVLSDAWGQTREVLPRDKRHSVCQRQQTLFTQCLSHMNEIFDGPSKVLPVTRQCWSRATANTKSAAPGPSKIEGRRKQRCACESTPW